MPMPMPALLALVVCIAAAQMAGTSAHAQGYPAQPAQAPSGPGGSDYTHLGVKVTRGGSGYNAFYVFEPQAPQPASAPLVVITHGYFEFRGYRQFKDLITHTVRKGNVVIYPRYQTTPWTPCAGSLNAEPCLKAAVKGIQDGIALLQGDPARVQPELGRTSYFGLSFGGILTANFSNRWQALDLPRPRVVFLDDPHDGDASGDEPSLDASLAGIPADALVQCHSGARGTISEPGQAMASCNAVFPRLAHIPKTNKNLVMLRNDDHGRPKLSSRHAASTSTPTDAYDHHFFWKVFDAMRSCRLHGVDCAYAMGRTPEHQSHGVWSDGVPVEPLHVQTGGVLIP